MNAEHIYYAAFSAALMAGAEPGFAQRMGYQMAYLASGDAHDAPHPEVGDTNQSGTKEVKQPEFHFDSSVIDSVEARSKPRPINPLSHVDWLKGGVLNQRGLSLSTQASLRAEPSLRQCKTINTVRARPDRCERLADTLNKAIRSESISLNRFCVALSAFYHQWCETEKETGYWLMMHAVHCFLWGADFKWQGCDEALTALNCSNKPMFAVADRLGRLIAQQESEPLLWQCLLQQMNDLPVSQQTQCMALGIAYRPELIDDYDLAHEPHRQLVMLDEMEEAKHWFANA